VAASQLRRVSSEFANQVDAARFPCDIAITWLLPSSTDL
jgi:hypothetical protein